MFIALIHWRIKPEAEHIEAFRQHWNTNNTIPNRGPLIAEFLSDSLPVKEHPYITWHLDPESLGDCKSFVTVGIWTTAESFDQQIAGYFNDQNPLQPFEKYRRRRVVFDPVAWRVGDAKMPVSDSDGVC